MFFEVVFFVSRCYRDHTSQDTIPEFIANQVHAKDERGDRREDPKEENEGIEEEKGMIPEISV